MRHIVFALFVLTLCIAARSGFAGELRACGVPESVTLSTEAASYCDIYQRRLVYREEAIKLKEQMRARAENFAAPRREALERYEKDVAALNERRSSQAPCEN